MLYQFPPEHCLLPNLSSYLLPDGNSITSGLAGNKQGNHMGDHCFAFMKFSLAAVNHLFITSSHY